MSVSFVLPRSSGVLLHPTSLPGPYGVGDLGPEAFRWVQLLAAARQSWWQILPLGPTGAGDSPYQSFSAFAGSITLLSPDLLRDDGLLPADFRPLGPMSDDRVAYHHAIPFKQAMLREAYAQFRAGKGPHGLRDEFDAYCDREAAWLTEYALFMSIRDSLDGAGLARWPADLQRREPAAMAAVATAVDDTARQHRFGQFLFDRQWTSLKSFAHGHGVHIIGDAPIFVSGDSADVWAHPDEYLLGPDRKPTVVAGVPPDYFSPTGQYWGNPLYNWDRMADTGYAWWVARLKRNLHQVDLIRLDHFRGFAAAWHIPATEELATRGRWVEGPRGRLFETLEREIGTLPVIAEDLGLITPDVTALREQFKLPGMRVIQFAVGGGAKNLYWPHNYDPATVAYTGTHDNDTSAGWYAGLGEGQKHALREYLGRDVHEPAWDLIRMAWASVAVLAITPLQDILGLGSDARMNTPGLADGNWGWRFRPDQADPRAIDRLAELTTIYNRVPTREYAAR